MNAIRFLIVLGMAAVLCGCEVNVASDKETNTDSQNDNSVDSHDVVGMPPEEEDTNSVEGLVFRYPSAEQLKAIDEGAPQ